MARETTGEMERERRVQTDSRRITMVDWREREINEHEGARGDGEGRVCVARLSSPEREKLVSDGDRSEAAKWLYSRVTIQNGDTTIRGNNGTTGRPNDHRRYQRRVLRVRDASGGPALYGFSNGGDSVPDAGTSHGMVRERVLLHEAHAGLHENSTATNLWESDPRTPISRRLTTVRADAGGRTDFPAQDRGARLYGTPNQIEVDNGPTGHVSRDCHRPRSQSVRIAAGEDREITAASGRSVATGIETLLRSREGSRVVRGTCEFRGTSAAGGSLLSAANIRRTWRLERQSRSEINARDPIRPALVEKHPSTEDRSRHLPSYDLGIARSGRSDEWHGGRLGSGDKSELGQRKTNFGKIFGDRSEGAHHGVRASGGKASVDGLRRGMQGEERPAAGGQSGGRGNTEDIDYETRGTDVGVATVPRDCLALRYCDSTGVHTFTRQRPRGRIEPPAGGARATTDRLSIRGNDQEIQNNAEHRLVCDGTQREMPTFRVARRTRAGDLYGRVHSRLGKRNRAVSPATTSRRRNAAEDHARAGTWDSSGPVQTRNNVVAGLSVGNGTNVQHSISKNVQAALLTTSRPVGSDGRGENYLQLRSNTWTEALLGFWSEQPWAQSDLGKQTLELISSSFSDRTKEAYTTHVRKWLEFCRSMDRPPDEPPDGFTLATFVTWLLRSVNGRSVGNYVSGLKTFFRQLGIDIPEYEVLKLTLRGARRQAGPREARAQGFIHADIMIKFLTLGLVTNDLVTLRDVTCIVLQFVFVLREHSVLAVRRRDYEHSATTITLTLREEKSAQVNRMTTRQVSAPRVAGFSEFIVRLIDKYIAHYTRETGSPPASNRQLFLLPAEEPVRDMVNAMLTRSWAKVNVTPERRWTSHALRRGAYSTGRAIGVPTDVLHDLAGWSATSAVWQKYFTRLEPSQGAYLMLGHLLPPGLRPRPAQFDGIEFALPSL